MSNKTKKLLILNLPYLIAGLVCTNLGEAWRIAEGADMSEKLLGFLSALGAAFSNPMPSLHPMDLLIGVCCGAGLRLAVYLKGKNAKKYRHGMEYGSARWGTQKDIGPFEDPVFANNVILTRTERLMMGNRPKNPANARNKNVLVVGGSGSGKTRFWLKPNLLQCHSSYVVTDPKGDIVIDCGQALLKNGYSIRIFNTINFRKSMHYNPFAYIHSEKDILKLTTTLIANTKGDGKAGDEFWTKAETLLYCALIGYIHNHIIFNSTTLDCARKFRDFRLSGLALARLSDIVCLEHRLTVIIRKPYGERQKRTEYPEKKSQRDEICESIDAALARKPKDFLELIGILREAGYEYKDGKQPALRGKGHARFARFRSLGKGYSVEELCEVIAGNAVHKSKSAKKTRTSARSAQVHQKEELLFLIDIRAKMQAGKGAGYARWAKVFNLKQMAKAMMFMEEHGIKSYAELKEKADGISEKCDALLESVKADEARMSEVSVLRKHLINYAKTKDVFAAYKASGYNREFYEAHRDSLVLRSVAKKAFDAYKKENGSDKKLPRISELNTEYSMLLERKKSSYAEYRKTKAEMQDWLVAQKIVQEILKEDEQKKEQLHEQEVRQEEENRQSSR